MLTGYLVKKFLLKRCIGILKYVMMPRFENFYRVNSLLIDI
jgi:hypothetical protein